MDIDMVQLILRYGCLVVQSLGEKSGDYHWNKNKSLFSFLS